MHTHTDDIITQLCPAWFAEWKWMEPNILKDALHATQPMLSILTSADAQLKYPHIVMSLTFIINISHI